MEIKALNAFDDNYIWVMEDKQEIVVVDPGQAEPVIQYIEQTGVNLKAILLTHEHEDHVGGVPSLIDAYDSVEVYGPIETKELNTHSLQEGDSLTLFGRHFNVLKTAGHTEEHISFYDDEHLFCGDALFSAGCGRVFTGDYEEAFDSMQKFNQLDEGLKFYAGHEYTVTNLKFALTIEEDNPILLAALEGAQAQVDQGQASLPSTIGYEEEINLFLQAENLETFKKLRDLRDQF